MSTVLSSDERVIKKAKFTANLFLFWLKADYTLTNKRIEGKAPNTFLGLIPLGSAKISQPLKTVASVSCSTKFFFKRLLVGAILLALGGGMIQDSFGGAMIFIVIGAVNVLNCYTATFGIVNNSGQNVGYEISLLEKSRVEEFVNLANNQIAEL